MNVKAAAERIIKARKDLFRTTQKHDCETGHCRPIWSELDLLHQGLLAPGEAFLDTSVYVCRFGQIHVCTQDACAAYVGTHNGTCPLTNAYHGHTREDTGYTPMERRTATATKNDKKHIQNIPDSWHANNYGVSDGEITVKQEPGTVNVFASLGATKKRRVDPIPNEDAVTPPPPLASPLPLPIDHQQQKHQKKKAVRVGPVILSQNQHSRLSAIAETIVVQLLYSDTRKAVNRSKKLQRDSARDQAVKNYYAARKGKTFPIMTEIAEIEANFNKAEPHLVILKRVQARIDYYVHMGLQSWETIINTPWGKQNPGARFESHMISLMYRLRRGLVLDGYPILQKDPYMSYLPLRIDLPLYGPKYESGTVNAGMKNIKRAYRSAIDGDKRTPESLRLLPFVEHQG